jgi:cytochrome c biogenesis protein CcmG/thiol:disulfide interchange protein DsbE
MSETSGRVGRLRLVAQVASTGLVVALLALLVWKVVNDGGTDLVADVRAGAKPSAPAFDLPVIWDESGTWPVAYRHRLNTGRLSHDELRGRAVVINFWASWCGPCKEEAPELAASARAHAGKVLFLGIDVQDFTEDAQRFLRETKAPYPSVKDTDGDTYRAFGLTGVPETYYLDQAGRVAEHSLGQISRRELEEKLAVVAGGQS